MGCVCVCVFLESSRSDDDYRKVACTLRISILRHFSNTPCSEGETGAELNPMDQYLPEEAGGTERAQPTQTASFDSGFSIFDSTHKYPTPPHKPLRNMCGRQMIYSIRDRALLMCYDNSTTIEYSIRVKMFCTALKNSQLVPIRGVLS
ncbi:hypothetical protein DMENIID0001_076630 [Sergentomyia squamirostris]